VDRFSLAHAPRFSSKASRILGSMGMVGTDWILQTLSKKVLPPSSSPAHVALGGRSGATADAMDIDRVCPFSLFLDQLCVRLIVHVQPQALCSWWIATLP